MYLFIHLLIFLWMLTKPKIKNMETTDLFDPDMKLSKVFLKPIKIQNFIESDHRRF